MGGGLFGSIRGLFNRHQREGSGSSVGRDEDHDSSLGRRRIPLFGVGGGKKNVSRWDSESPVRPVLPTRRVSEDVVPTVFSPVRGRVMSMSDVSPVKRRQSTSLDPGVLREHSETEGDIVDLGRRERQDSLVRAEEWVDSQKRQESPTKEKKADGKKKKSSGGLDTNLGRAASLSTPALPDSWAVANDDVTFFVPVDGGGISRSSSTRSRAQSTASSPSTTKAPRHRRSSSSEQIPTSSPLPATIPIDDGEAQRRSSSPVTFNSGSTSLMSIVEDVARTNREAWSVSGSSSGVVKSIGGTVKPLALVDVKAPRSRLKNETSS